MTDDLRMVLTYSDKGYFASKKCEESSSFYLDLFSQDMEGRRYMLDNFIEDSKKAMKVFNSSKVFDVEVTINTMWDIKLLLIRQSWQDKEAGVFEIYDYTDKTNLQAKVTKMSKSAVLNRIKALVNQTLKENNLNIAV